MVDHVHARLGSQSPMTWWWVLVASTNVGSRFERRRTVDFSFLISAVFYVILNDLSRFNTPQDRETRTVLEELHSLRQRIIRIERNFFFFPFFLFIPVFRFFFFFSYSFLYNRYTLRWNTNRLAVSRNNFQLVRIYVLLNFHYIRQGLQDRKILSSSICYLKCNCCNRSRDRLLSHDNFVGRHETEVLRYCFFWKVQHRRADFPSICEIFQFSNLSNLKLYIRANRFVLSKFAK